MGLRDELRAFAENHLDEMLDEEKLRKICPQKLCDKIFYTPDIKGAQQEIDGNRIEGLLWDYKVTPEWVDAGEGTSRKKVKSFAISKLTKKDLFYSFMKKANSSLTDDGEASVSELDKELKLGNGGSWCRNSSRLAQIFKLERKKECGKITSVELKGWNREIPFSQRVRKDIWDKISKQNCVMLGTKWSKSENMKVEVDHKDGRKNDKDYNDIQNQREEWFQPLCKAANDFKRQKCKECKDNNKRWSACALEGFDDFPFYIGDENFEENGLRCEGCYLYDPVMYRKAFRRFVKDPGLFKDACRKIQNKVKQEGSNYDCYRAYLEKFIEKGIIPF